MVDLISFYSELYSWYETNHRDLPWRKTSNPYLIWVSEIILQQTQVKQGLPYYERFVTRYPDVSALAQCSEDEVLVYWKGLGYYSRARNMHKTARYVMDSLNGVFPSDYKTLITLPGIGDYTAAAISSFSANEQRAVLDGNVFRLLSRLYAIDLPINSTIGKKRFVELVNSLLDYQNPALFNQSVMEFGALFCTPKNPSCPSCCLLKFCAAGKQATVEPYPVKTLKIGKRERNFKFFLFISPNHLLIQKRGDDDIWANLFQLPHYEVMESEMKSQFEEGKRISYRGIEFVATQSVKHLLSHQRLTIDFYIALLNESEFEEAIGYFDSDCLVVNRLDVEKYSFPAPIYRFLIKALQGE